MNKIMRLAACGLAVAAFASPGLANAQSYDTDGPGVDVTRLPAGAVLSDTVSGTTAITPGETISIYATGFLDGEMVKIWGDWSDEPLGTFVASTVNTRRATKVVATAAGNASISGTVSIPDDAPAGSHALAAIGVTSNYGVKVDVTIESGSSLPFTGAGLLLPLVGIGAASVFVGSAVSKGSRKTS